MGAAKSSRKKGSKTKVIKIVGEEPIQPGRAEGYAFPEDFVWGTATAAYQVEGAAAEDGRGSSIWDDFSHKPGNTYNGDTGDRAVDQYHRYKEDVALMKSLGLKAYRMSVSWPRVLPEGRGRVNEKGLDYYQRLVDELLANGIQPWLTLYHWDLPLELEKTLGGWRSRETAKLFGDYAALVANRLSDRVQHWFTINEFWCFTVNSYGNGVHAPGLKLPPRELNAVCHNALLAHGHAVRAIRAAAKSEAKIGLAENMNVPVPAIETPQHIEAAKRAARMLNARFLTAVLEGRYPPEYLSAQGADAPKVESGDFEVISSPLDFVGLNMYTPTYVLASQDERGFKELSWPRSYPTYNVGWLRFGPSVIYWGTRHVTELWNAKEVYVTENGACCDDVLDKDGEVYDTDRVVYLREHLIAAHRAISEGYPLRGYFLWSLMDNFEWAEGYAKRFGICYVHYETLRRIPKLSAKWYSEVIRAGKVV